MSSKHKFLQIEGLARRFPDAMGGEELVVFDGVDFAVDKGEFVCLIGHSGCGKSTILNIIAGLDSASEGYVFVGGREVTGPGLERGVIFQNHSLLPWKSALENVQFSVRARWPNWSRRQVREHAEKFVGMVGLSDAKHRKPSQLSGGMRQRVGIARAFAIEPKLLLMDEPFGALDALTRATIQDELIAICRATKQTVFMITHDVDEAVYLADRVLLMSNGPHARIAEAVEVPLERPRVRAEMLDDPRYHRTRSHLLQFLIDSHGGDAHAPQLKAAPTPMTAPEPASADGASFSVMTKEARR
ncbi:MAG: ABC transporter ATP-binding protein [Myxococcales bacterium]|nr:ABC transporter ATP-binding protein [Myxococcales bacterium]MDD9967209.1 ABC transporter ATP-binding protein [Myxococcales bacterium]